MGDEKMENMYGTMESMYGKIRVKIKGISPLLMNRCTVEKLRRGSKKPGETYDDDKEARESAYITVVDGEEQLYIPYNAVFACILTAARGYKVKELKSAMNTLLAGCMTIEPEKILLGHCNYEVFVIPARVISAKVPRARAKVLEWEAEFFIIYDRILESILDTTLKEVVGVSGRRAGLLDWRPQKKGKFGKFIVEEYSIIS